MAQFARPNTDQSKIGWSPSSGTNIWVLINETVADDVYFGRTTGSTSSQYMCGLTGVVDPLASTGHTVVARARASGSSGGERMTIQVFEGTGTPRGIAINNVTVTRNTWINYSGTLAGTDADSITNYNNLYLRVTTPTIGTNERIEISWMYFEVPDVPEVTVNLSPATLSLYAPQATVNNESPPTTINLQPAILSLSGQIATPNVEVPPTTINLQPAILSLSGESSLILKGDVSIPLGPAQLSLTGEPSTIQKGEVSVPLDPARLSLSGKQSIISQMDLCSDSSRDFNGSSDRIDWVSPLNTKEQPLTVAAWLNIDALKANQYIWMSHSSGTSSFGKVFNIVQSGGWYLDFVIQRASQSSFGGTPGAIPTGTWGHVAVTHDALGYSASNVTFYYNGVTGTTTVVLTGSGAEGNQTGSWSVGGRIYDNTRNIDAKIGEVAVWNRVLTREEIARLANRANPISATNIYDGLVFASHPETLENLVNHQVGIATGTVLQSGPCLTYNTVTYLNAAQLSLSGKPVQVNAPAPGIQINLQPALLSLSAKQASVQKGAVTVTLDPALLTLSGKNVTISAPAPGIQINLQPAILSLSAKSTSIQKGAVSIALDPALLSLNGKNITISTGGAPQTINLQPARLTLSGKSSSIQKGAVSISLDPALLNLSGNHATIITPYSQTINLDPALLSLSGQIAHPDNGYIPPSPAPCIPTGGGGLLKKDVVILLFPKDEKKRKLDEDVLIIK